MQEMRRKDRQVDDPAAIRRVMEQCQICRVGFQDGGEVYIVPLSFGFVEQAGQYTLYFHSATAGRKVDLFQRAAAVGFEMDRAYQLVEADTACGYTARYESVIGTGRPRAVPPEEAQTAMCAIMAHYGGQGKPFSAGAMERVRLFAIEVTALSCKAHL